MYNYASPVGRSLSDTGDEGHRQRGGHRDSRAPTRRYLQPNLGVLAVAAAGVLCAFCCVIDALPEQCLRRRPCANPLVAAVFRTKRLLRERCSATCPRRRRPGQARHTQGGLQITAVRRFDWATDKLPTAAADVGVLRAPAAVATRCSVRAARAAGTCVDTSGAVPGSRTQGTVPGRIRRGSPQRPVSCQHCPRSASALSPSARRMAALGAEPQLRVWRKSSGRTRQRSSISCCGSQHKSSTRAQKRAW
jgi:hypothetical protein